MVVLYIRVIDRTLETVDAKRQLAIGREAQTPDVLAVACQCMRLP
jgi:hypothetical protein